MSGLCGALNIKIAVTAPANGDASLITVPSTAVPSITFAASSVVANAGAYTCIVQAGYGAAFTTVISSATLIFTYIDLCLATYFY
jgi:hypothetical protein